MGRGMDYTGGKKQLRGKTMRPPALPFRRLKVNDRRTSLYVRSSFLGTFWNGAELEEAEAAVLAGRPPASSGNGQQRGGVSVRPPYIVLFTQWKHGGLWGVSTPRGKSNCVVPLLTKRFETMELAMAARDVHFKKHKYKIPDGFYARRGTSMAEEPPFDVDTLFA